MSVTSPVSEKSAPEKPDLRLQDVPSRPRVLAGKIPIFNSGVFWAATPALALFALAALTANAPLPAPLGKTAENKSIISASAWIVPASDTILVTRQSAGKYSVLRGQLEAAKGDAVVAPAGGVVSQVLVQRGQSVRAGQQIAVLTTGVAPAERRTQVPSVAENLQSRAEAAQIAAAKQQEKLESRMNAANAELQRAKERVVVAQERVAEARRLIARLRSGEQVSVEESPAAPSRSTPRRETGKAAHAAALRESQKLQSAAEAAEAAAKTAAQSARDAEAAADAKQQKLKSVLAAKTASAKTKPAAAGEAGSTPGSGGADNSADEKASGGSNSAAVASAREIAESASAHALDLKREAVRLQTRATQARSKANDAARRVTQDLQVFDGAPENASAPQRKARATQSGGKNLTVAQAARIAKAAMQESDAAIKNAERIQKKVESYGRPVASTRRQFDQAAQQLEAAQQRMWDSAPIMQTRPTPVAAPRDGVVTWVAAPTTVLHSGEAVASVGRPDRLEVVVEDKSGAWKTLKPDMRVLALVQRKPESEAANAGDAGSTPAVRRASPRPVAALTRGGEGDANIPTLARVLFVAPPAAPGQAARVRIAVHNPPESGNNANGLSPRAFAPGMKVFFSIAQQSKQTAIRIPTAAVRRGENGKTFVAVLAPVENAAQDRLANECRVEWREVLLAPGDGISNRVKMGLREGERLALRPGTLYDYTLAFGPQATVSVEQI
jgi:hypothetical protein